ncbi:hypothetical protein [Liquorilactobacillus sicerae]|uniref:hypothetical protein n=1 Tax=Liquorilactobacillus sicerae TaxID=1416943 RepID=UPI00248115B2|nr:hypothetical protein [Liquorilactobacillus sicerae]
MKNFNLTFGSENILKQIIIAHPERQLKLLISLTNEENLMLFDFSDLPTIFKAGLSYQVIEQKFVWLEKSLYCFDYFKLNTIEQKEFQQLKRILLDNLNNYLLGQQSQHDFEFVIISSWQNLKDYHHWKNQSSFWESKAEFLNSQYTRVFQAI